MKGEPLKDPNFSIKWEKQVQVLKKQSIQEISWSQSFEI